MALQKQNIDMRFGLGLDTKTDPWQVQPGKFLSLVNTVFIKGALLQKRNGFGYLTALPDATTSYLTTFNGDLTAIGTSQFRAYSAGLLNWVDRGAFTPLNLSTLPLIRSSTNQSQQDTAINNGLVCTSYADYNGSTTTYRFAVADLNTGQILIAPTALIPSGGIVVGAPRVFALGNYFIVVFGVSNSTLQYQAVSAYSLSIGPAIDIDLGYTPTIYGSFDAVVAGTTLYFGVNSSTVGVKAFYLTSTLLLSNTVSFDTSHPATTISVAYDMANNKVWYSYWDGGNSNAYSAVLNPSLTTFLAPTQILTGVSLANLTQIANNGTSTIYWETTNTYSYNSADGGGTPAAAPSNFISSITCSQTGTVGSSVVVARSVGLASKAFVNNSLTYMLVAFQSVYQPSYWMINGSGQVCMRLSYSNGGGYMTTGLPSVVLSGSIAMVSYLTKDVVEAVNKAQLAPSAGAVYSQTGINLAKVDFSSSNLVSSEIAESLHVSGGMLWQYDGYTPVEHGFNVWPDSLGFSTSTTGGSLTAQIYNYQVTYEWADNQGNVHRSAPSVPLVVDIHTSGTSTNSITLYVPTLRLTYKIASPVKIVIYRWSTAQEIFYQTTSILQPILNNTTVDSITYVDVNADSSILGNNIIYTTGGVVEQIPAPATNVTTLYKTRLFLVDAEDPNLLWYSKQVIENVPVEMSDLFTIYVPPTASAGVATGGNTAISVLDDKLIMFKQNAIAYLTGEGPDNTGANNDYSDAFYITSTLGCTNQRSIVFMPNGLMFQAADGQGIWLLGRDLITQYVGAPVESFNSFNVLSAVAIPGTTQVRFNLSSGVTLLYDYYYQQWGSFQGVAGISSTIFQTLHTQVDAYGRAFQETPGLYLDGSSPVLMSFTTSWMDLTGLQGYQRFYFLYMLGRYLTPFKLNVGLAYDFEESSFQQTTLIVPSNDPPLYWGSDSVWGGSSPWGGNANTFKARLFPQKQKCESFQISVQEVYDPSFGVAAGAGLTLSGFNLVIGGKKLYRTNSATTNYG
jgi:hypothetical protein